MRLAHLTVATGRWQLALCPARIDIQTVGNSVTLYCHMITRLGVGGMEALKRLTRVNAHLGLRRRLALASTRAEREVAIRDVTEIVWPETDSEFAVSGALTSRAEQTGASIDHAVVEIALWLRGISLSGVTFRRVGVGSGAWDAESTHTVQPDVACAVWVAFLPQSPFSLTAGRLAAGSGTDEWNE